MACAMNLSLIILAMALAVASSALAAETTVPTGSDTARLAEVREILREVPLVDGHNDLPWQFRKRSNDFAGINLLADTSRFKIVTDIPRLRAGGVGAQFWSVYVPSEPSGPPAVKAVLEQIDVVYQIIAR